AVFNRYRELRNEYDRWQSEQRAKLAALGADQIERAYRDLVAAVDVVASKKRIDIVYRFIPTNDPFQAPTPDAAQAAVSLRTALKYPSGLDITPEILDELALDDE
ncbi:MAG: hypothetical protein KDA25_04220, partial [Phycisphaerales bacterium]|nr:hypothetical protein [Phycisphaerales bacterium]